MTIVRGFIHAKGYPEGPVSPEDVRGYVIDADDVQHTAPIWVVCCYDEETGLDDYAVVEITADSRRLKPYAGMIGEDWDYYSVVAIHEFTTWRDAYLFAAQLREDSDRFGDY